MKKSVLLTFLEAIVLTSCAPAATEPSNALQKHALTVYRALNTALAEDVDLTIADLVKSVDGSCMKKASVGDTSWPDAPQGTAQCSIQAAPSGKVDEFSITIVGDESTGNFRYVIP